MGNEYLYVSEKISRTRATIRRCRQTEHKTTHKWNQLFTHKTPNTPVDIRPTVGVSGA